MCVQLRASSVSWKTPLKEHALQKDLTIVWCHFVWGGVHCNREHPIKYTPPLFNEIWHISNLPEKQWIEKSKGECRNGGILENIFFSTSHRAVQQEASSTTTSTEKCSSHSQRQTNGSSLNTPFINPNSSSTLEIENTNSTFTTSSSTDHERREKKWKRLRPWKF